MSAPYAPRPVSAPPRTRPAPYPPRPVSALPRTSPTPSRPAPYPRICPALAHALPSRARDVPELAHDAGVLLLEVVVLAAQGLELARKRVLELGKVARLFAPSPHAAASHACIRGSVEGVRGHWRNRAKRTFSCISDSNWCFSPSIIETLSCPSSCTAARPQDGPVSSGRIVRIRDAGRTLGAERQHLALLVVQRRLGRRQLALQIAILP